MTITRRSALIALASITTTPMLVDADAQTTALTPTPSDSEGPFYPTDWSGDIDGDLITVNGKRYNDGTSLLLTGRVLSATGSPIAGARIEIWQVDATGKYRHPNDDGEGPFKRGFQGFGRVESDGSGAYRFRTIKPIAYRGRPAHIHIRVAASGFRELTTQVYFAGENKERSGFGGFSKERDKLTVSAAPLRGANAEAKLTATFDLVLLKA